MLRVFLFLFFSSDLDSNLCDQCISSSQNTFETSLD